MALPTLSPVAAGALLTLAIALPVFAIVAGALHLRAKQALRREAEAHGAHAASQHELAALHAALDQVAFGIVLLDREQRTEYINRAFRRIWRLPDHLAEARLPFVKLMDHEADSRAYLVAPRQLADYVAEQMALIRTGGEQPLDLRLANGEVLRFRCTALPDGGCLLTYGNVSDLIRHAETLAALASTDGLTGLYNRRHFLELAASEWGRFKRYGRPLALLLLDIDRFKSINDTHGHDIGDLVLKEIAEGLRHHTRTSDIAGRVGGEEFVLLLPETSLESACLVAERFRQAVAERTVAVEAGTLAVTASIGVSCARADTTGIAELMKEADLALYEAKHTGRNRICAFDPPMLGERSRAAAA